MISNSEIRAAFFDVDGTLLSFDTHLVPPSTVEAFRLLREKGIRIFIATGRSATNLTQIAPLEYDGVIALNGTDITLHTGEAISHHPIAEESFVRLLDYADRYSLALSIESDDGLFINKITPEVKDMSRKVAVPLPVVTDIRKAFVPGVTSQLCLFCDADTEKTIMPAFPELTASRWCDIFADINAAGYDKGTALREVCEYYGIASADTIAFGDGGNDIPMLEAAGTGVAMGNASSSVKGCADYVTASVDDDGIMSALTHFAII